MDSRRREGEASPGIAGGGNAGASGGSGSGGVVAIIGVGCAGSGKNCGSSRGGGEDAPAANEPSMGRSSKSQDSGGSATTGGAAGGSNDIGRVVTLGVGGVRA